MNTGYGYGVGCGERSEPHLSRHDSTSQDARVELKKIGSPLADGESRFDVEIGGRRVPVQTIVTDRERRVLLTGGLINAVRQD
jgi:hypothetical protein